MHVKLFIVTRSVSIAVKTLHSLLNVNRIAAIKGISLELNFVNDDLYERRATFLKALKSCDRIVWINYSVHVDNDSVEKMFEKFLPGYHALVFPCVTPGIDWDMFRKKVNQDSSEPVYQMGLNFDTQVGKSVGENLHIVTSTDPKAWALDTKHVLKALKGNNGEGISVSPSVEEMFTSLINRGVKVYAFTAANLIVTYPHECIGNLLSAAGVETSPIKT
jgi:hypothetical protein